MNLSETSALRASIEDIVSKKPAKNWTIPILWKEPCRERRNHLITSNCLRQIENSKSLEALSNLSPSFFTVCHNDDPVWNFLE